MTRPVSGTISDQIYRHTLALAHAHTPWAIGVVVQQPEVPITALYALHGHARPEPPGERREASTACVSPVANGADAQRAERVGQRQSVEMIRVSGELGILHTQGSQIAIEWRHPRPLRPGLRLWTVNRRPYLTRSGRFRSLQVAGVRGQPNASVARSPRAVISCEQSAAAGLPLVVHPNDLVPRAACC